MVSGMSKYIDAEKIKQTFCAECNHTLKCEDCDIDYHFRYATAADVAEVRHGRWKCVSIGRYACSLCGREPWYEGSINTINYCPNCGALMELKNLTDEVEE